MAADHGKVVSYVFRLPMRARSAAGIDGTAVTLSSPVPPEVR